MEVNGSSSLPGTEHQTETETTQRTESGHSNGQGNHPLPAGDDPRGDEDPQTATSPENVPKPKDNAGVSHETDPLISQGHTARPAREIPKFNPLLARNATAADRPRGTYIYCGATADVSVYGCEATFSCFRPRVERGDHSILQFLISTTAAGILQTIEAGWRRNPEGVEDGKIVSEAGFFTYFTANGYSKPGEEVEIDFIRGYNAHKKGWVQSTVVPSPKPGQTMPYSHIDGVQNELSVKVALISDSWWFQVNGQWIGSYPCSLFRNAQPMGVKTLADGATTVQFYGEVFDGIKPRPSQTTTDMGSGMRSTEGYGRSAYIKTMKIQPQPWFTNPGVLDFVPTSTSVTNATLYDMILNFTGVPDWGNCLFLGGPGAPSSDWLDWDTIGGNSNAGAGAGAGFPPGCPVTAVSRTPDFIDLFVCASDGNVYTSYSTAGASFSGFDDTWANIGGNDFPPGARIAAVAQSQNNLDLFVVGKDGAVYTSAWTSTSDWTGAGGSGWQSIGGALSKPNAQGQPTAEVTAVSRRLGLLDVFACDIHGTVISVFQNESSPFPDPSVAWPGLSPLNTFPAGANVACVTRTPDTLDLFITGSDGIVYWNPWSSTSNWFSFQQGGQSWVPLGGGADPVFFPAGSPVTAVSRTPGNLDLFVAASDSRVYTSWWTDAPNAGWLTPAKPWKSIGGGDFNRGYHVSALSRDPNSLDVFACASLGGAFTSHWVDGSEWSGIHDNWTALAGSFSTGRAAQIGAVAKTQTDLDLFVVDHDGKVEQTQWSA